MCITITHICICAYPMTQKPTEEGSYTSQPQRTGKHLGETEMTDGTNQVPMLATSQEKPANFRYMRPHLPAPSARSAVSPCSSWLSMATHTFLCCTVHTRKTTSNYFGAK